MTIAATSSHERMALRTMSASFGRRPWGPARTAGYDRRVKPGNSHDAAQRFNRGRPGTPVSSRGAEYFTIEALQAKLGIFHGLARSQAALQWRRPSVVKNPRTSSGRPLTDRSGFAQPGKNFSAAACNASKMKYFGFQPSTGPWGGTVHCDVAVICVDLPVEPLGDDRGWLMCFLAERWAGLVCRWLWHDYPAIKRGPAQTTASRRSMMGGSD
jgi:hypothetical protein